MDELLLNPRTKSQLQALLSSPPHALLLMGEPGAGKETVAQTYAASLLQLELPQLENYPYFKKISPLKDAVTIEQVRELQKFMQLKTTGKAAVRRIGVLVDAHLMTVEAQNALLKMLEEPPADTVLILTAVGETSLKPTIYSRAQRLTILPPTLDISIEYFKKHGYTSDDVRRNYLLTGGATGLLSAILQDQDHALHNALETAKMLLSSDTYTRLTYVDQISKDKALTKNVIFSLKRIAQAALHNSAKKQQNAARYAHVLQSIHEAESVLKNSPNSKLLLTHLFMEM